MDSTAWDDFWKSNSWPPMAARTFAYDPLAAYTSVEMGGPVMQSFPENYSFSYGLYQQASYNVNSGATVQHPTSPWANTSFDNWQLVHSPFTESTVLTQPQDNPESAATTPLHSASIFEIVKEERNSSEEPQKKRKRFSEDQCKVLECWFQENYHRPIISAQEKSKLSDMTGMTVVQVNDWLSRKRKRLAAISKKATAGVGEETLPSDSSNNIQPRFEEDWRSDLGLCPSCDIPSTLLLKLSSSSTEWWFNTLLIGADNHTTNENNVGEEQTTCQCSSKVA